MTTETLSGEQPAIAENSSTDVEVTADAAPAVTGTDDNAEPRRKTGAEARIDELTRLRREAERDRDYWREHATRQNPAQQTAAAHEQPKAVPKLEDFNYDEAAYQIALVAHVKDEAARQVRDEFRKEQEQLTQKQRIESWRKRESEFAAKTPDYEDKAYRAPIPDEAADIIRDCENGPAVAYYLGDHPDEARALHGLSATAMARVIGRIEAKLEAPAAPALASKPVSKAPPPPPKIDATEPAVAKSLDDPDLTDAEFEKIRRRQIAQRRNR